MKEKGSPNRQDREKAAKHMRQAMIEIAQMKGGQDVAEEVIGRYGDSASPLPHRAALRFMEIQYPGSISEVVDRAFQIQQSTLNQPRNPISRLMKRMHI